MRTHWRCTLCKIGNRISSAESSAWQSNKINSVSHVDVLMAEEMAVTSVRLRVRTSPFSWPKRPLLREELQEKSSLWFRALKKADAEYPSFSRSLETWRKLNSSLLSTLVQWKYNSSVSKAISAIVSDARFECTVKANSHYTDRRRTTQTVTRLQHFTSQTF